jgi:hypothetical protein
VFEAHRALGPRTTVVDLGAGTGRFARAVAGRGGDGPPANGVYTRNALHQIPDFWKGLALARIRSLLEPGGVLRLHDLVYDMEPGEALLEHAGFETVEAGVVRRIYASYTCLAR